MKSKQTSDSDKGQMKGRHKGVKPLCSLPSPTVFFQVDELEWGEVGERKTLKRKIGFVPPSFPTLQ